LLYNGEKTFSGANPEDEAVNFPERLTNLHHSTNLISQKTLIFINTAVETSCLSKPAFFYRPLKEPEQMVWVLPKRHSVRTELPRIHRIKINYPNSTNRQIL
jgi:hypothetical protein